MEIDLSLGSSSTKSKNQKSEIQSIYDELNKRNKPKLVTYGNDLLKEQRLEENNQSNNVVTLSDYKTKECDYEFL
mgnify:FL=1